MPETDKLLTDLHISYIQGLGQASSFFQCRSLFWHQLYRTKMTSSTISPLTWDLTPFIGGLLRFVFSVTQEDLAGMRWSTSWWVVGTRRQVLYFALILQNHFVPPYGRLTIHHHTGAFGAHPNHDAHLLSTLSAIQILVTQNALDRIEWSSSIPSTT